MLSDIPESQGRCPRSVAFLEKVGIFRRGVSQRPLCWRRMGQVLYWKVSSCLPLCCFLGVAWLIGPCRVWLNFVPDPSRPCTLILCPLVSGSAPWPPVGGEEDIH